MTVLMQNNNRPNFGEVFTRQKEVKDFSSEEIL
jgi:hypothetical protein